VDPPGDQIQAKSKSKVLMSLSVPQMPPRSCAPHAGVQHAQPTSNRPPVDQNRGRCREKKRRLASDPHAGPRSAAKVGSAVASIILAQLPVSIS
jgi:hypothetical protein